MLDNRLGKNSLTQLLTIVCGAKCILILLLTILKLAVTKSSTVLISFGEKVRMQRKLKSISQEELAFRAGLHRTYIGMIERAEKNITLLNIEKIANALELPIEQMLDFKHGEKETF